MISRAKVKYGTNGDLTAMPHDYSSSTNPFQTTDDVNLITIDAIFCKRIQFRNPKLYNKQA